MKHLLKRLVLFLFFVMGLGISLVSCTEEYLENELLSNIQTGGESHGKGESQRSINRILAISDSVLDTKTRGIISIKTMTPVVEGKDTVAYIINYPNNKGFTIISTYNAVPAVLAYSKENCFSMDNEAANLYFVNNIGKYTAEMLKKTNGKNDVYDEDDIISYTIDPVITIKIGQRAPFDSVVKKYHPNCIAGCGPVAGAMIMAYCKESLTLGDTIYGFKAINKALTVGPSYNPFDSVPVINPNGFIIPPSKPLVTWIDSYGGAVSAMSHLLYALGLPNMMNCEYDYDEKEDKANTSNTTVNALKAFKNAGYIVGNISSYDEKTMVDYLNSRHIYFQHGSAKSGKGGHYWAIDGCKYDYSYSKKEISNCEFYCHWGWYGACDGYYKGKILKPDPEYIYNIDDNFWVKIEIPEADINNM
ncbi:MAG: hypothetical protein HDS71_03300 [Bacteroidales bacterium]|nr:hypothetical protein [Bacteroidales bacterium]MBD5223067.1 hypothetical protein [Bacteroidales bacterium]MBD5348662.1 hypothetical protein [Bacteroides sp.]